MVAKKYKEKVPGVSDPNQNDEITSNPNPSLQNLRIYSSKGFRKSSQRWIMNVANTVFLELRIFWGRYHFRLLVFASTGEYFYYWHWRVLPNVFKVNDAKTFKNLVVPFQALWSQIICILRIASLNWNL